MESHFLKAFDSELLSSKKTSIFVIWVPFRLHWKWKGLLSDLLCHQFSLFPPSCCGLLYILISCTVHLMEYFFDLLSSFPRSYLTMLVLKSLCPFLPCLLCCYALPLVVFLFCGSPLAPPSSLCITSLSYPSLSSPLNSNPLIFRGLLDNRTKIFSREVSALLYLFLLLWDARNSMVTRQWLRELWLLLLLLLVVVFSASLWEPLSLRHPPEFSSQAPPGVYCHLMGLSFHSVESSGEPVWPGSEDCMDPSIAAYSEGGNRQSWTPL